MDVKLDKLALKALSNDTRVEILKELQRRRYTQTELAEELELSVPTVKEHLVALEKAGLVEMHDEGRKWKYYSLTKKSKAILQPESVSIFIVLGTLILSVIGGVYSYIMSIPDKVAPQAFGGGEVAAKGPFALSANDAVATAAYDVGEEAVADGALEMMRAVPESSPAIIEPSFFQLYGVWIFAGLALISVVLFVYFLSRRRSRLGKILRKK